VSPELLCRLCSINVQEINNFGMMPLANSFRPVNEVDIYRFELKTAFCTNCKLFQIANQPEKELMFHEKYPFFTGLSKNMTNHFRSFVENSILPHIVSKKDPFVIEIGSNDGTLLKFISEKSIRHLGIDPSSNVVERAKKNGINTLNEFFSFSTAKAIKESQGKADVIAAANVICHLPDLGDLFKGVKELLADDGIFIFEEPYLLSMLNLVSFDQIYDEHVYIFSLLSISNACEMHDLELYDAETQSTHGGSMRYYVGHKGKQQQSKRLQKGLSIEILNGLENLDTYIQFEKNCEKKKVELIQLIENLKKQGKSISGYAATSKSTTVLNYCGIDSSLIDYICDSTPEKIGMVSPGSNIPIVSIEYMHLNQPDYLILFAWNHEVEIMRNEKNKLMEAVKWIKFVPSVEIFSNNG
jgi:methylation protein EvaC